MGWNGVECSRAEQGVSRAEQSRAEQSRLSSMSIN